MSYSCYYDEDDYEEVDRDYEDTDDETCCCTHVSFEVDDEFGLYPDMDDTEDDEYDPETIDDSVLKCCKFGNAIHLLENIVDDCLDRDTVDAIQITVNCLRNEIRNCSMDDEI